MQVNFIILLFTGIYLAGTLLYYKYAAKKGIAFRYKPFTLIVVFLLFLLALYGIITQKPYNEILPFIR
ncbi:hypothetical protein FHW36_103621 [Chitinophaga polysaccharea]|uniref:Uncharacterized protein n=1 Tax=Chitinophaga polysaccharea TaxID=1293035 RepID=A0A561PUN7_9BACT|nr:hypothetical protein [Chitinophaga polysaccharea]TWF41817.1 hypothetical protein FHW36_103621 [Chitinophaga polysaccharea]